MRKSVTSFNRLVGKKHQCLLYAGLPLLTVSLLFLPSQSSAQTGQAFLYGTASDGNLYAVNPNGPNNAATVIPGFSSINPTGTIANGLASNGARSLLYFHAGLAGNTGTGNSGLGLMYYFNPAFATNTPSLVTFAAGVTKPTGRYSNASFYNNAYWAFLDDTDTLVRMNFNALGTQVTSIDQYTNVARNFSNQLFFGGDIAIRQSDGVLFGYAINTSNNDDRLFFSLNLQGTPTQTSIQDSFASSVVVKGNNNSGFAYQLGFSTDETTLFGASSNGTAGGNWQSVNISAAPGSANFGSVSNYNPPGAANTFSSGGVAFLDMSSAMVPTPAPPGVVSGLIGIAMGGAQFGIMRFRKRRRAKKDTDKATVTVGE